MRAQPSMMTTHVWVSGWIWVKLCKTRQREASNWPSTTLWSSTLKLLYKPVCHGGFEVSRARTDTHSYHMLRNAGGSGGATGGGVECSCWPSLCHCSPPSLDPVCSTLCSNCHNYLLVRQVILHNFVWHVQCMVHDSWAFGWINPLFFEPVGTSPHPTIWLTKVGLLSRYGMVSWNRAPRVCREGSSNKPPALSWARFA